MNTTDFVNEIREQLEEGYGFVPFVGSGISARSGILMSSAFSDYLAYCVWRTAFSSKNSGTDDLWDLTTYGWPPYPHDEDLDMALTALCDEFDRLGKVYDYSIERLNPERHLIRRIEHNSAKGSQLENQLARPIIPSVLRSPHPTDNAIWVNEEQLWQRKCFYRIPNEPSDPNCSPSSPAHIRELAIRSLAHWTTTLEFLSSLCLVRQGAKTNLVLGPPNSLLIDTFNQHITRGREPNIIHNLLARLSPSLRTHLILTTNFDTLTEDAFTAQGEPLHTIAVSSRGGLPPLPVVRPQNCLIKLHGDLIETRADSSINQPPSAEDLKCFHEYLTGPTSNQDSCSTSFLPNHLLVMGYSASDPRCVKMIKYVLDFSNSVRVFWVCHNGSSVEQVKKLFPDYIDGSPKRFSIVQTDRTDLLLWELFQNVTLSLPGGGYPFKFTHNVPPLRSHAEINATRSTRASAKYTLRRQGFFDYALGITKTNVLSIDYGRGLSRALRDLFEDYGAKGFQTIWMELEDHRNSLAVVADILGAITLRMGSFQTGPANFLPDIDPGNVKPSEACVAPDKQDQVLRQICDRVKLLCAGSRIIRRNWVLFFYARNGPGGCSGWAMEYWSQGECQFFEKLLLMLSRKLSFHVIYLPFGKLRFEANESKVGVVAQQSKRFFHETAKPSKIPGYAEYLKKVDRSKSPPGGFRSPVRIAPFHQKADASTDSFYSLGADYIRRFMDPGTSAEYKESGEDSQLKISRYERILGQVCEEFLGFPGESSSNHVIDAHHSVRIHWLYGMTLFRQSRHAAAKISEAIFPCPWKFHLEKNPKGEAKDNDFERYRWVIKGVGNDDAALDEADRIGWSNWLESTGLLLRKPGGYSWKYRDTRLGLQQLLDSCGKVPHFEKPFSKRPEHKSDAHLWQLRPRFHYMIAEWYWRAFQSSGHFSPLTESVYHASQAVILSNNLAVSSNRAENCQAKIRLCWYSICLIRRCIRHGATCFNFWTPGADVRTTFLGNIDDLRSALVTLKGQDAEHYNGELYKKLVRLVASDGVLEREINILAASVRAEGFPGLPKPSSFPNQAAVTAVKAPVTLSTTAAKLLQVFRPVDRLGKFENKMQDFKTLYRKWAADWLENSADAAIAYDLAWELSTFTYRIIRNAKLKYHVTNPQAGNSKNSLLIRQRVPEEYWRVASFICYYALKICRFLPPDHFRHETELRVQLLASYGLALGCLGRISEATRRFNEAHALALLNPTKDIPLQITRIELRRAEMCIYRYYQSADQCSATASSRAANFPHGRVALAAIDDSWAAIERGEEASSKKLHSSFWLYRIAVTKLSCLAALTDACEKLNADPLGSLPLRRRQHLPTEIERLLVDALFSANDDLFRQLRAIDYAIRASKLRSWLPLLRQSECLSDGTCNGDSLLQSSLAPFAALAHGKTSFGDDEFSKLRVEQRPLYRLIAKILTLPQSEVRRRANDDLSPTALLNMFNSVKRLVEEAAHSKARKR